MLYNDWQAPRLYNGMKITAELLVHMGAGEACKEVRAFTNLYPEGLRLTRKNIKKAREAGLNVDWFFRHALGVVVWKQLVVPAWDRLQKRYVQISRAYAEREITSAEFDNLIDEATRECDDMKDKNYWRLVAK